MLAWSSARVRRRSAQTPACPSSTADYSVQVEMSQPFVCPLDHSYELPEMYNLGLDWREHSFFARSAHPTPSFSRGLREAIVPPPSSSTHSRAARISHPLTPSLHSFSSTPLAQPTRTLGRRPLPYRRRRGPHRRRRFSRADGRPLHSRADTRDPRGQRRDICRGGGGACSAGGAEMSPRCRRDVAESPCPSSTRDTTFTWQPPSKYGR